MDGKCSLVHQPELRQDDDRARGDRRVEAGERPPVAQRAVDGGHRLPQGVGVLVGGLGERDLRLAVDQVDERPGAAARPSYGGGSRTTRWS
jgi:hypothetical protein